MDYKVKTHRKVSGALYLSYKNPPEKKLNWFSGFRKVCISFDGYTLKDLDKKNTLQIIEE